jgi:AGZA family xanthine/uracil permease-like MFS transporter
MQLDFYDYFNKISITLPITLVLLFVSVLDTSGVQVAIGVQANLLEGDKLPQSGVAFAAASIATMTGACLGTSPVIIHTESCAGVQEGARTGLSSVVIALCFIITLPFAPILASVPQFAAATPLAVVGMFMMTCAKFIDWDDISEALPAFLIVTLIPMTYSIADGTAAGIIAYAVLRSAVLVQGWFTNSPQEAHINHSPVVVVEAPPSPWTSGSRKGSIVNLRGSQIGFSSHDLTYGSVQSNSPPSRLVSLP